MKTEEAYQKATAKLPGDLIIDLGPELRKIPAPPSAEAGALTLKKYAASTRRVYFELNGVRAVRLPRSNEPRYVLDGLLAVLERFPAASLDGAFGEGISISELPDGVREDFLGLIATTPAVATSLDAAGPRAVMRISYGVEARLSGAQQQPFRFTLGLQRASFSPAFIAEAAKKPFAPRAGSEVFRSDSGPLDFGSGKVARLTEIAEMAGAKFGRSYFVDSRLKDQLFFIKGSFSQRGFESTFSEVMHVSSFTSRPTAIEDRFLELVPGRLADYSRKSDYLVPGMDELAKYPTYTAAQFAALGADHATYVKQLQLSSSSEIGLMPVILISVNGGTPATTYIIRLGPKQ